MIDFKPPTIAESLSNRSCHSPSPASRRSEAEADGGEGRGEGELKMNQHLLFPCSGAFALKPQPSKKTVFAKRTQSENHKTLQTSRMRKCGLASFPKRTPFPGRCVFKHFRSRLLKPIQGYSRSFNPIQGVLGKKDRLFFMNLACCRNLLP
jgi:hypothetical protein